MTAYRTYNTYALLTTVLVLVLSVLACAAPGWTTASTTPVPTVVRTPTTVPTKLKTADNTLTTVAASSLHVRRSYSERAAVLGYLYADNTVTLTGVCLDGWAQIRWQGKTAWVKAKWLSGKVCQTSEEQ